jgi:2-haloacid dehalogenase
MRRARGASGGLAAALLAAAAVLSPPPGAAAIDCVSYRLRDVKLITFDVFAALMDTPTALRNAVFAALGSELGVSGVDALVTCWITEYSNHAGEEFNATVTGPTPFQWVARDGLAKCLAQAGALDAHPPGSAAFEGLAGSAWRQLSPWPGTGEVLERLNRRWPLATLSNGDAATLRAATRAAFEPAGVTFSAHYSSDAPVLAFKPHTRTYEAPVAAAGGDPAGVLHVAGGAADAAGARAAGIPTVLLRATPGPGGGTSVGGGTTAPCWVLKDISELELAIGYPVPPAASVSGTGTSARTQSPTASPPVPVLSAIGPATATPTRTQLGAPGEWSATPTATAKLVTDGNVVGGGGGGGSPPLDGGTVFGLLLAGAVVGAAVLAGGFALVHRRRRLQRAHALAASGGGSAGGGGGGDWVKPPAPGRAGAAGGPATAAAAAHSGGAAGFAIGISVGSGNHESAARVNPVRACDQRRALWG